MIHKQYMDFINTSPTYIFTICVILACKGLKLLSILNSTFFCPHTPNKGKEVTGPPFAMVTNVVHT